MGRSTSISLCICVVIVFSVLWKPAYTEDKCAAGCKGSPSGASYLNGHKYTYSVEGAVTVYLTGADKQETGLRLSGQVAVTALGNCAHILRVLSLQIAGPDGKKYNKPEGIEKPVRFTLQDGRLGSEICAEEGDNQRSLNIKRAIISLLQNSNKQQTEVDVFGVCPTEVSSSQEGDALLVHRARDLGRCAHREQGKQDLVTAIYNPHAEIKNTQVLQSSLNVESKVKGGIPEKVSATEEYLYKPFSVGQNGARAKVTTQLTLKGQASATDSGKFSDVRTIIFENPHPVKTEHSNQANVLLALKTAAQSLNDFAGSRSAGVFAQLIRIFRVTSKEDLLNVYGQIKAGSAVKDNHLAKKVFLDALLRAGTGDSIEASIQLLKTKELNNLEQKLLFLSLGNARHVSGDALKAATELLDVANLPKEVYLGVGALAGSYCREHKCHGSTSPSQGVAALSQKMGEKLGDCKPDDKLQEDYAVAVLKGIRSIRHLDNILVEKIAHCASDRDVKPRVKVAAIEAFHADPCTPKLKKTAIDLMKNRQLDSEIRIKAYLAIIDCPCGKSANEIKNLLETENINQVGRFISSSLRHIRASSNPDKQLARQHYGLIRTPSKWGVDDRKYSHYRELSYNVDALGIGGALEETIIYSQDSFLPRSAAINVTAELFGHSLNILEVGGRQGNLDRVVEHFMGPKGIFRKLKPQQIYDMLLKKYEEMQSKVEGRPRSRRAIPQDINNFDRQIKGEFTSYNDELDLDIYVKLFGTDTVFLSFGDGKGFQMDNIIDQLIQQVDSGIHKAKHFSEEVRAHLLFLDAELTYPTSVGLPLKLNLIGSATGRLKASGAVDIRQIIRDPKNAKLDIELVPSADIEVSGSFVVDAEVITTGLKVITNLHTSTGAQLNAKILESGRGFDIQLALPVEKQEIVTASNDLVYITREIGQQESEIPLKIDSDVKDYSGCFDQLSDAIGLVFCGEINIPFSVSGPDAQASLQKFAARYPLTGASKVSIYLQKHDLRGYHIKGILRDDNPEKRSFDLLLEAQGSKANRKTSFHGELINDAEERTIKLELDSPIKHLSGQVSLFTKKTEYSGLVRAQMDAEQYYGRLGFIVQGDERRSVYKPIAEYQIPGPEGKQVLQVEGDVIRENHNPGYKYTFNNVKLNMPTGENVQVNGFMANEVNGFSGQLKAVKGEHSLAAEGFLKGPDAQIQFQNTLNPYVNFKATIHSVNQEGHVQNDLDLIYGPDSKSTVNRLTFNQLLKYQNKSPQDFSVITNNKLELPSLQLFLKLNGEVDPKKLDIEMEGKYQGKKAEFELEARTEIKKPGDYNVKLEVGFDDRGIEIFSKRDIVTADKSNFENYIAIKNLAKYELSGVVLHKTKPNDLHIGAVGHFKVTGGGKTDDIKFDIGAQENVNLYSSHAKISKGTVDMIDFLLKVNRGTGPSGQLKLVLKDTIAANGQFKLPESNGDGKGNGLLIVDFKKASRKIKADVKFVTKEPAYSAEIDLYLNFEKDNNDKVQFSTNTRRSDTVFDSKNELIYGGKKTELKVKREMNGDFDNGKYIGQVELVMPDERIFEFNFNRDFKTQDNVMNGQAEVSLSDTAKRGATPSKITYKAKMINTNYEKDTINYDGQISIVLSNGKNLESVFSFKNNPNGENYKLDYKTELSGNLIPKAASLSVFGEYSDPEKSVLDGFMKYKLKGNYGTDLGFELTGNEETKLMEAGDKKYEDQYNLHLRLPFEDAHDIKVVSNVLYLLPDNKDVLAEFSVSESVQVNNNVYKVDASGKFGKHNGFGKVKLLVPHVDPFAIDASYKANLEGDKKSGGIEMKATYGKGKSATIDVEAQTLSAQEFKLLFKAKAPQAEKLKKLELTVHNKNPSPDTYSTNILVDADGKIYKADSQLVLSSNSPFIDLKYTCPENQKQSRILIKRTAVSPTHNKGEVKIENVKDFNLDMKSEAELSKDNFFIKAEGNSANLGLNNFNYEISTKDTGSGKRVEINVVNDNKNILSGSTSFISKREGSKTIVEGSGTVKLREQQKSANFKYIRDILTDGAEQGVENFLNIAIGERSYVTEYRLTNLEYKNSYLYCEEKKQCAHIEINSKINAQTPGMLQHTVNIGVDLRKLGVHPEFGLEMSSEVSEKRLPQYTLDVHLNRDHDKYHLHVYSQPKHGQFPAGITVTLPKRIIALESSISYPGEKGLPFPLRGEVAFYLNKHQPDQKAAIRLHLDVTDSEKQQGAVAELGFSHPSLGREASIKFRGNLQRPAENSFRIESATSFSHPTFGPEKVSKLLFDVNPTKLKFLVDTPLVKVIDLDGSATLRENFQEANLKMAFLEGKPVIVHALAKDYLTYEFTTGYSDESERKLSVVAHLDLEKRVDVSADIVLPGQKKNIIHGALFLQDNLLKSDYGASSNNFNYFVNAFKNDLQNLEDRVGQLGQKAREEVKVNLEKGTTAMEKIAKAYQTEIQKLKEELVNDKTLKEIDQLLSDTIQFVAKIVDDVLQHTSALVKQINTTVKETFEKIVQLYEKQLGPQLKELYANVGEVVKQCTQGVLDIVSHFAAIINDFFEKHKEELQELTNTFTEIFKDLTRLLVARLKEFRTNLVQLFTEITQQIKEMPVVAMLKEKWEELAVPEQVLTVLLEAHNTVRGFMPTEEVKKLADAIYSYVEKKIKQEKVDDVAELRTIYEKFALALTSLVQFARQQINDFGLPLTLEANYLSWNQLPSGQSAPSFGGAASFSFFNYLLGGDLPMPIEYLKAYRPRTPCLFDEIPSKLRGVVVNGQHLFTFDGQHLTFPGNCRYVLAHDHVDRNFTLLMQLQGGQPKAIVLQDKSGQLLELKDNGQVALNGAVHGFPVEEGDVYAFRHYSGIIGFGSKYGVKVFCTSKLTTCYVEVSGFYLGKLRGLLGDGNNEPFDDFRLPNGKIAKSEAEFGNGYKLSSSCSQVKTPEHSHDQHHAPLPPACDQVFGGISPLRPLSLLLDVTPFRQACIHATAANPGNALQEACDLGRGYAALAVTGLMPTLLPAACLRCTDGEQPRQIGDNYQVKLPGKQADVVVAVETTKGNEKVYKELIVPLVSQVVDALKSKHVDDIKVHLVGITSRMPYPIFYDIENVKLKGGKVSFEDESRYNEIFTPIHTGVEKVDNTQLQLAEILSVLQRHFGATNVVAGYSTLALLPLRPGAVKTTISVVSEPCQKGCLVVEALRTIILGTSYKSNAHTLNLVTVTPDLVVGEGKQPGQVVGYDDSSVLLLGDKGKGKNTQQLRSTLQYKPDACIDFVQDNEGLIFSASNFVKMNGGQQKQFVQTAGQSIVERLLRYEVQQECVCLQTGTFSAQSVCAHDSRKPQARRRK